MNHRALFSGAINYSNLIGFKVKLAIESGCYKEAEYLIDLANQNLRPGASLRHRAEIAAQQMHLALCRDVTPPTQSEVAELLTMHYSARSFNWHDYVALVLFEALIRCGERAKSAELAAEYITTFRRGLSPISPELARCLDNLNVHYQDRAPTLQSWS
jgi:hypothetical protein